MKIDRLDHLVLTVRDIGASIASYVDVLGMEAQAFGTGRHALRFGAQKIDLHSAAAPRRFFRGSCATPTATWSWSPTTHESVREAQLRARCTAGELPILRLDRFAAVARAPTY